MKIDALIDSHVLIAIVDEGHEHHGPSLNLLAGAKDAHFAITAHSYAEAYNTLTQRGDHAPFRRPAEQAWAALESVRAVTSLVGLTAAQTFAALRSHARSGGIAPRLNDRLIGEAAVAQAIPTIVTWNVGHMRGLFPDLFVTTPTDFVSGENRAR